MLASNAKNFLCGSLVDQRLYFDELLNRYNYPEIFPCALLEKSLQENIDFEKNPLVYTSHKISVDRFLVSQLKSNDSLHILIRQIAKQHPGSLLQTYECYGLVDNNAAYGECICNFYLLSGV